MRVYECNCQCLRAVEAAITRENNREIAQHLSADRACGSNQDTARAEAPAAARAVPTRRPRLPRDAHVSFSTNPAELYVSLTMTKIEHLEALMETLQTYAPQLEHARRRNEED